MNEQDRSSSRSQFLNLRQKPATLFAEEVAYYLNIDKEMVPVVVSNKKLKLSPLGKPTAQAVKKYATVDIEEKIRDRGWLDLMTHSIYEHNRRKNSGRKDGEHDGE